MHIRNIVFAILFSIMTLCLVASAAYIFMTPINNALGMLLLIGSGIYAFVTDGHIKASLD